MQGLGGWFARMKLIPPVYRVGDIGAAKAQQKLGQAGVAADNFLRQFPQFDVESFADGRTGFIGLIRCQTGSG